MRKAVFQMHSHGDSGGFELVLYEREGVSDDLVQVGFAELGGGGAGEVQQAVGNLGGAKGLLGDALEQRGQAGVVFDLLGEHLRVGADDGERGC